MPWYARGSVLLGTLGLTIAVIVAGSGAAQTGIAAAGHVLGLDSGRPAATASPLLARATRLAPPTLAAPAKEYTRAATIDVHASVPASAVGRTSIKLRIYVNGKRVRERPMGGTRGLPVRSVPLVEGTNTIQATLVSRTGESERSNRITVIRDETPPQISISDPVDGSVVNAVRATVRGSVDPESVLVVHNAATRQSVTASVSGSRFGARVVLAAGTNLLTIVATDPAGNRTERQLSLVKGDGKLKMTLALSRTLVYRNRLPGSITATVTIKDPDGQPVDDADVALSISPPGLPTSTFETVTKGGTATWTLAMPREGALAGRGFATVLVMLPDGRVLRATQSFTFV